MPSVRAYGDDAIAALYETLGDTDCFNALGAGVRR